MNIKLLHKHKLQITLTAQDLAQLGITYESLDYVDPKTRKAITRLLERAQEETGFSPQGCKLLIEAYPLSRGGCVVCFTTLVQEEPKGPPLGREPSFPAPGQPPGEESLLGEPPLLGEPLVFQFEKADTFLEASCKLYRQYSHRVFKSSAYALEGRYYLALRPIDGAGGVTEGFLREFGCRVSRSPLAEPMLEEHGALLAKDDALDQLNRYF